MQILLRAYRDAKDNNSRTGAFPCMGPFMGKMEDLFGKKPIHSKSETFYLGSESIHSNADGPVSLLASSDTPSASRSLWSAEDNVEEAFEEDFASASLEAALPSNSSYVVADSPILSSLTAAASSSTTATTTTITRPAKNQKKMSRSEYYMEKIKQREAQAVQKRVEERQRAKAQHQKEKAESRKVKYELIEKLLRK